MDLDAPLVPSSETPLDSLLLNIHLCMHPTSLIRSAAAKTMKYLLLDLNGTLHIGSKPTPGAVEALQKLHSAARDHGWRIRYCSNSSKTSSTSLRASLVDEVGLSDALVSQNSIFTSLDATASLVASRQLSPLLLLNESAQTAFDTKQGFKPTPLTLPKDLSEQERKQLEQCDAVVVGLAPALFKYEWLTEAFRLLSGEYANHSNGGVDQRVELIGTHRANYLRPGSSGQQEEPLALGPGPFLSLLEQATSRKPEETIIVGKPREEFFRQCLAEMGWTQEEQAGGEAWIVGDDWSNDLSLQQADVATGKESSTGQTDSSQTNVNPFGDLVIKRALVKTGKYRQGDEDKVKALPWRRSSEQQQQEGPDVVCETFADWVDWFVQSQTRA